MILVNGASEYFTNLKQTFMDAFSVKEKRQFKQTINCLLEVFSLIARDSFMENKIINAVNRIEPDLKFLWLGKILQQHLLEVVGRIAVRQYVVEKEDMPKVHTDNTVDSVLSIARAGALCNLISETSAERGYLFEHKIVCSLDWEIYEIKPPEDFR